MAVRAACGGGLLCAVLLQRLHEAGQCSQTRLALRPAGGVCQIVEIRCVQAREVAYMPKVKGGSGFGQLALQRRPFSVPEHVIRACIKLPPPPKASASLGRSAAWAALAGHTSLV